MLLAMKSNLCLYFSQSSVTLVFSQNTIMFIFAYACRSGSPEGQHISAKDVSIGLHENSAVEIREVFFLLLEPEVLRLKAEGEIKEELARSASC